ncbi:hypothetical protein Celgi_3167 [Cellulomonas gilvus ATCC 13127]|uniref:Uncharacterized protein n=1 Tax=Cellulomonas gilvus (strain ATCC 13127 / NRRL B-14078) TaxID=593907 RepID=F7ZZB0_CELGA|nr:hypothetical protein Celgi_3167 [Cellulomonas gilvus ATCC 13127]
MGSFAALDNTRFLNPPVARTCGSSAKSMTVPTGAAEMLSKIIRSQAIDSLPVRMSKMLGP